MCFALLPFDSKAPFLYVFSYFPRSWFRAFLGEAPTLVQLTASY